MAYLRYTLSAFTFIATLGAVSMAQACSDLPNICQMNMQHHQNMMDIAATPPQGEEYYEEEEPYYYDSSTYPPMEAANDMVSGMSGMLTAISKNQEALMADPRRAAYLNGEWMYPGSEIKNPPPGLPCAALFMRKGVTLLVLGPTQGETMASIIFIGPDIPSPSTPGKVQATLEQASSTPQTTNVMNMPLDADFGAVLFAVPTMPLLVDNMLDKDTFKVTMNGKAVAELEMHGGAEAKSKLAACMKK
ncbi:MAG: hypothetical protein V4621_05760 [Pseudomonadota bacterium]